MMKVKNVSGHTLRYSIVPGRVMRVKNGDIADVPENIGSQWEKAKLATQSTGKQKKEKEEKEGK